MDATESGEGPPCPLCGGPHERAACSRGKRDPTLDLAAHPSPPSPAADPLVGSMVGSFRIQRRLGRGGMGTVYLAEHPVIGSKVAIKFLHESMCASPELVGRFYDEARAVNLIGHENIVGIYDLALLPPARYYIVMEYLEGEPMSALLRAGRVPTSVAIDVLHQLADALRAAHGRGVVHRDLKPDNVFVLKRHGDEHFVKLVDFGIAKLVDRQSGARTAAGMIVGTPEYMAPEQCSNGLVDRRTDVYALGVMAYEVATGRLPFTGPAIPQILIAHVRDAPVPPRQIDPSVPPAMERIILKALAKRPEDRFQDMAEVAAALEQARRELAPAKPAPPRSSELALRRDPDPELEVRGPDGKPRRLRAAEVTRGGLFLCDQHELPPLRSQVRVMLPGERGRSVEVAGEVVRHVSPSDAAGWKMSPGFAVQLGALGAAERAALDRLAARLASPREVPAAPAAAPETLEELDLRAAAGPYELLGASADAGFPEIRERARAVRAAIEAARARLPPDQQTSRVPILLARVDAAASLLGTPAERLMYDARHGNFRGVAHCVTAGTTSAVIEARRRAFLAERPRNVEEAKRHLARAQVATKLGNAAAALAEYEAALTEDPLDLTVHQAYWELLRKANEG